MELNFVSVAWMFSLIYGRGVSISLEHLIILLFWWKGKKDRRSIAFHGIQFASSLSKTLVNTLKFNSIPFTFVEFIKDFYNINSVLIYLL